MAPTAVVEDVWIRLHLVVPIGMCRRNLNVLVLSVPDEPVRRFCVPESICISPGAEPHLVEIAVLHDAGPRDRDLPIIPVVDADVSRWSPVEAVGRLGVL